MSRQQKMFLAVLVCVAVAFGLSLMLGGGQGDAVRSPSWLEWAEGLLVDQSALSMRQTSAPCKKGEVYLLFEGETCRVEIGASEVPVRKALLRLDEGARVAIELRQKGTIPQRQELSPKGDTLDLSIFEKRTELVLRCLVGAGDQGRRRCELSVMPPP